MGVAASSPEAQEPVRSPPPTKKPENPRILGLTQLHPDPNDSAATQAKKIEYVGVHSLFPPANIEWAPSIIVIHGLDARSDKTFIAWKVDDDRNSGDVNWLSDPDMLPAQMPQARILTYDWNANYDETASQQTMLDHADMLLETMLINRDRLVR